MAAGDKRVIVVFPSELFSAVTNYHQAVAPESNVQEVIRELIQSALASVGQDAVVHAARRAAFNASRRYVTVKIGAALRAAADDLEKWNEGIPADENYG